MPESTIRPLLFARLNEFLGKDLKRSGAFLFGFYKRGLEDVDDPLYSHRLRFANTGRALRLLDGSLVERAALEGDSTARVESRLPGDFDELTPLGKAQYLEIMTFLDTYLLHSQGDRMLMGNSIEGRFPFLDYRVAEFAAALPDTMKVRGLEEKYLLRKAAAPLLPAEIWSRRKRPYRAPIVSAFVGPGAPDYVRELLDPGHLRSVGLFQPDAVSRLVQKCETAGAAGVGETDEMGLVGTLSVMILHDRLVERPTLASAAEPTRVVVGDRVHEAGAEPAYLAAGAG